MSQAVPRLDRYAHNILSILVPRSRINAWGNYLEIKKPVPRNIRRRVNSGSILVCVCSDTRHNCCQEWLRSGKRPQPLLRDLGTGEPLILSHGGVVGITMFGANLAALSERRQVIAVELQGHGHTADIDRP